MDIINEMVGINGNGWHLDSINGWHLWTSLMDGFNGRHLLMPLIDGIN
jgi:hypothetical protein